MADRFADRLVQAAIERTKNRISYNGAYFSIPYPGGDIPAHLGVCTDVIIRAYRKTGFDLQKAVHEDMQANFSVYPSKRLWGLNKPDANIDHRRVPNLQVFFTRNGLELPVSTDPADYRPGDLVTWMLPGNLPHIGIVVDRYSAFSGNPLVVHNIGKGPVMDDVLFQFKMTGHYRFNPETTAYR